MKKGHVLYAKLKYINKFNKKIYYIFNNIFIIAKKYNKKYYINKYI